MIENLFNKREFMKSLCLVAFIVPLFSLNAFGFGYSGSNGSDGYSGRDGSDGQDVTIVSTAQSQSYLLNAFDATSGGNATSGSNAGSCSFSQGHSNEYGADGGDGGDGGLGGDGGNGGNVTVFYENLTLLKNIYIESKGGLGAPGGYGASSGHGCGCSTSSWTLESCSTTQSCTTTRVCETTGETRTDGGVTAPVRVCHDRRTCNPVTSCTNKSYSCYPGKSGVSGRDGYNGQNGTYGTIKLVKNLSEIPVEIPQTSLGLVELSQNDVTLSKQIWENRSGANHLFANGSNITNSYSEFIELSEGSFKLVWKAARSIDDFSETKVHLSFDGDKTNFKLEGEDFFKFESTNVGTDTILTVVEAYKKSEISNLVIESTKGHGDNLRIKIKDKSMLSLLIKTGLSLQFVYKPRFLRWRVVYDKEIPASALEITEGEIVINVGKLGINPKFIKRKRKVRFTLNINRAFGDNSTNVKLFQSPIKLY
jgi:hypothetical protein